MRLCRLWELFSACSYFSFPFFFHACNLMGTYFGVSTIENSGHLSKQTCLSHTLLLVGLLCVSEIKLWPFLFHSHCLTFCPPSAIWNWQSIRSELFTVFDTELAIKMTLGQEDDNSGKAGYHPGKCSKVNEGSQVPKLELVIVCLNNPEL